MKVADYLLSEVGIRMMRELEKHLNKATIVSVPEIVPLKKCIIQRKFVCRPCKVAFDDRDKYFVHCQMTKHLNLTVSNDRNEDSSFVINNEF